MEIWTPVTSYNKAFADRYEVSDLGRVRSLDKYDSRGRFWPGQILKPSPSGLTGYESVALYNGGRKHGGMRRQRTVHLIVLDSFVGPCPPGMWGRHLNGDHLDNRRENLAWGTPKENAGDTLRHGHNHEANRTHCRRNHPLEEPNLQPTQWRNGVRTCWACALAHSTARKRGHKITQELADEKYASIILRYVPEGTAP